MYSLCVLVLALLSQLNYFEIYTSSVGLAFDYTLRLKCAKQEKESEYVSYLRKCLKHFLLKQVYFYLSPVAQRPPLN